MKGHRLAIVAALMAFVAAPVVPLVAAIAAEPSAVRTFAEVDRLALLATNSLLLALIAAAVALPFGTFLGLGLGRLPIAGRGLLRAIVLVGVFIPLPIWAIAWQAILGQWVPSLGLAPGAVAWRAWNVGLLPAGWIHGMAATPWVAWIVSSGLHSGDRGLEEQTRMLGGTGLVLKAVMIPAMRPGLLAALAWVVVQTATDIPITDAFMVRTFAEEAYTQLIGSATGLAAATATAIPIWLLGLLLAVVPKRFFPDAAAEPMPVLPLSTSVRLLANVACWSIAGLSITAPVLALVLQAGGPRFAWLKLAEQLRSALAADGALLLQSLLWSVLAALGTALFAQRACWAGRDSARLRSLLIAAGTLSLLTPGPLLGLGLKGLIQWLVETEAALGTSWRPIASALYDRPAPWPCIWVGFLRWWPVAALMIWPSLRAIPNDLWQSATVERGERSGTWSALAEPSTRRSLWQATLAIAALNMAEVSASKLAAPPAFKTYVLRLFDQMHYGAEPNVAAMALLQIAASAALAIAMPGRERPSKSNYFFSGRGLAGAFGFGAAFFSGASAAVFALVAFWPRLDSVHHGLRRLIL